jgi:ribosomal protein S18 acetylase RimI-like enzyme
VDEMSVAPVQGLTPSDLEQIADLEARVVAHDGGRLKLEWGRLRGRSGEVAEDVLARSDDGRLVGFAGLYGYGANGVEIAGMVDPDARRRGLGGALLDAAVGLCAAAGGGSPMLIVARDSVGGRALAQARGGALDHSEHALVLSGDPVDGPSDPALSMRTATPADVPAIVAILSAGFGYVPADLAERLVEPDVCTLVMQRTGGGEGEIVGTMRAQLTATTGGIFGFAVDPAHQGRGIGRDFLRRACRELRGAGATRVGLEVEVQNDRALGLYTSLGFTPVVTEDYWRLPA